MKAQTRTGGPQCRHCTVPVDSGGNTCAFCASYVPPATPAQRLDVAVNRVDLVRADGNEVLRSLPTDAPLFATVDLVRALGHLRMASVLIDGVSDALESAGGQVMGSKIVSAPERALQHAQESRRFVARVILPASGERRIHAMRISKILDAAIAELKILVAEVQR